MSSAPDRQVFLQHAGRQRRYLVHWPPAVDPAAALPVVLALHGGAGWAEIQREQSRMNEVADRHGFLVVYPDGTGRTRMKTWNAGTCCGYAVEAQVDDVGFIAALLDDLAVLHAVDPARVYACGMSNGGMLCYRLACELSERVAAVGVVAGDMGVDGPRPSRPVPVIHFHGLLDENARFHGGIGSNQVLSVPHRSIPDTIAWWVRANRCAPEPRIRREPDCEVHTYEPAAGSDGAPVMLYVLPGGGHTWPGGVDVTRRFNTGPLIPSVDASELMWEFFTRFALRIGGTDAALPNPRPGAD